MKFEGDACGNESMMPGQTDTLNIYIYGGGGRDTHREKQWSYMYIIDTQQIITASNLRLTNRCGLSHKHLAMHNQQAASGHEK